MLLFWKGFFTLETICLLDINECEENPEVWDLCHIEADCEDTEGSHKCVCIEGFTGNGTFCSGSS